MSGHTPTAMSWSMARSTSTVTPLRAMMPLLMSISPSVLLSSGDRLSVQLTNSARRSSKAMWTVQHDNGRKCRSGKNLLMSRCGERLGGREPSGPDGWIDAGEDPDQHGPGEPAAEGGEG